ncbi:hypothetical protein LCGC14_1281800 [marine sediment metagenome]|uniref:ABC transmembrane type-1 domain-containing protein n=1 Tax=marine sediment metagenome TaxID=412755 RepID=A0A0F9LG14_9ZZZZ
MIFQVLPKEIVDFLRVLEFWDHILVGLAKTMWLYVWALLLGFFLGLPLALLRQYGGRILSRVATGYIEIVRGTPLLAQLFLLYFLPYSLNIPIGRWSFYVSSNIFGRTITMVFLDHITLIAILTLGLNSAAYQAEYLRGSVMSVGTGQLEAAQSLGMSRRSGILHIVLPQALRRAIPAWSNEAAYLPKYTVIVFTIGVTEIFAQASHIISETFLTLTTYIIVALIFLVIISLISKGLDILYKRTAIPGL